MTSTHPALKSVMSAITTLSPPPLPESPYSLSALVDIDSPDEGEQHLDYYPFSSYDCDSDSPSCYDSDSLLDVASSYYLGSEESLDTSVSWYCRGDGDQDDAMHIPRSGQRTPLSPARLDTSTPLLDSKVFILRPVRLPNDDFDFTCAGPEQASNFGARVKHHLQQSRLHPPSGPCRDHHHNHDANYLHAHYRQDRHSHHHHNSRHHLHKHRHHKDFSIPDEPVQISVPELPLSPVEYLRRRWSAPNSSPESGMLTRAATTSTMTGTLNTPFDPLSSGLSQDVSGDPTNVKPESTRACVLQMYSISDAQNHSLMSKLNLLQISSTQLQRKTSSSNLNTPTPTPPKTWPQRRHSEVLLRSGPLYDIDVDNFIGKHVPPKKERSQTLGSFCASNKWGDQPPIGYI